MLDDVVCFAMWAHFLISYCSAILFHYSCSKLISVILSSFLRTVQALLDVIWQSPVWPSWFAPWCKYSAFTFIKVSLECRRWQWYAYLLESVLDLPKCCESVFLNQEKNFNVGCGLLRQKFLHFKNVSYCIFGYFRSFCCLSNRLSSFSA